MISRNIEKAIQHALDLKDKGVAEQTILAVFPEEQKYIRAVFGFTGVLKSKREELDPSIETFESVLRGLPELPKEEQISHEDVSAVAPVTHTHRHEAPSSESNLTIILFALGCLAVLAIIVALVVWKI